MHGWLAGWLVGWPLFYWWVVMGWDGGWVRAAVRVARLVWGGALLFVALFERVGAKVVRFGEMEGWV